MPNDSMVMDWTTDAERPPHPLFDTEYMPQPMDIASSSGVRVPSILGKIFMFSGSGSRWDTMFSGLREHTTLEKLADHWPVYVLRVEYLCEPLTVTEKITKIQDAFGLSVASLANVLGASRASVYNWINDEPPLPNFTRRIDVLYGVARDWKEKNPYHFSPGRLMKQKLGDDPSMFERLSRDELDMGEIRNGIESLLMLMHKQRETMDRAKARSAKAPKDSESHKELLERLTGSVSAGK